MKNFIFVIASLICFLTVSAQAQDTSPTKVSVTLTGDPQVRDLPDTSLQDQINEQSKRNLLLQKQSKLDARSQKELSAKAGLYYQKGREIFKSGKYTEAQKYFEKAIFLDASVDQYYHELAITLFKNNNYRRSLALLANLDGADVSQVEVDYYSGLNLFKMNQTDYALKKFRTTQDSEDPTLSPLAAMYAGITYAQLEKYTEAKASFQHILDTSKDPELDKKAESYIETIERYEGYLKESKKKWAYSFFAGTSYDENVLNLAAVNSSTGTEAYRLLYGGSVSYRALYTQKMSWTPVLSASDIYSFDKDFQSDATIQGTDPLQWDLSSPFRFYFSKFALTLLPGYQQLYMSLGNASRELTFSSAFLRSQISISHFANLYTDYKLDFSSDTSHLTVVNAADDQSASKITAGLTNTYLMNDKGSKTIFSDLFYVMNNANGDNNTYTKALLNLGYSHPLNEKWILYTKLEYFNQDFSDSASGRKDKNIAASIGGYYAWSERSTVALSLLYMDNDSSVSFFSYDKIAATAVWSFNSAFF